MSTEQATRNEAAQRLREGLREHGEPETEMELILLDEALATERRTVVEQVRERIGPMGPSYDAPWNRIAAILDSIATGTEEERP